jgi:putative exporter of polyketide antibiotics
VFSIVSFVKPVVLAVVAVRMWSRQSVVRADAVPATRVSRAKTSVEPADPV